MLLCELDVMEYAVTMEESAEDFDEVDFDDVDECGFNPYMGCYDFDCQSKNINEHTFVRARPFVRATLLII